MTVDQFFRLYPKVSVGYKVGHDVFLEEEQANAYSGHFNLGKPEKVERPEGTEQTAPAKGKGKGNKGTPAKSEADKVKEADDTDLDKGDDEENTGKDLTGGASGDAENNEDQK